MTVALDVGTHTLKSLREGDGRLEARRHRTVYCVVDDTENHRDVLKQLNTPFAVCEQSLLLVGDAADKLTQLFRVPRMDLFPGGELHSTDPLSRQIAAALVETLIGKPVQKGELCALVFPADLTPGDGVGSAQREFLTRVVRLLGYDPLEVSASQALVLAELGNDAFTGIGLTFGASSSQSGLIHRGNVLAECALPYAGNWIDLRLARAQGLFAWDIAGRKRLDTVKTQAWRERFDGDLRKAISEDEQQLADLHRGMVEFLLRESALKFGEVLKRMPIPGPLPMVISGGAARVPGFRELIEDVLPTIGFPVQIGDVRLAVRNAWIIPRGGLIRAELEAPADTPVVPAAA